jgi:hypothetical protein
MCIMLPRKFQCLMHGHLDVVEHLASQPGVVPVATKQLVPKRTKQAVAWQAQALQGVTRSSRLNQLSPMTRRMHVCKYASYGRTVGLDLDNAQPQYLQLLR